MICNRLKTAQGMVATSATALAIVAAWWQLGRHGVVFSEELAPRLKYDAAGTLGNGSWGYTAGTYEKDAGPDAQRLYLNGARVAQMSDTRSSGRRAGRR